MHNCKTILQPCLAYAESFTPSPRPIRQSSYKSDGKWCASIHKLIQDEPRISQIAIRERFGISQSVASKALRAMVEADQIDRIVGTGANGLVCNFYVLKEYLQ